VIDGHFAGLYIDPYHRRNRPKALKVLSNKYRTVESDKPHIGVGENADVIPPAIADVLAVRVAGCRVPRGGIRWHRPAWRIPMHILGGMLNIEHPPPRVAFAVVARIRLLGEGKDRAGEEAPPKATPCQVWASQPWTRMGG
jgi:hypothetical protein